MGSITPDVSKRLIKMPDVEREQDMEFASYNAVEMCISQMLRHGRYRPPQPYLNIQQGVKQVQLALVRAWADGRPEDRLQLLRDWITDAMAIAQGIGPQPQQAATQANAAGTPVAAAPAAGTTPMMQGGTPPMGGAPPGAPIQ